LRGSVVVLFFKQPVDLIDQGQQLCGVVLDGRLLA
jgi:hypothetical protein